MKALCRRVGHEYDLLEVVAHPGRDVQFRLLGKADAGGPGLWDARLFTVTWTRVPSGWVVSVDDDGAVRMGPAAWQREGFWEAYFDGEPAAVEHFQSALADLDGV